MALNMISSSDSSAQLLAQQSEAEAEAEASYFERQIGTQGLTKRILTRGVSWQTPSLGDQVQVHFRGRLENGASIGSTFDTPTPFTFKLGQCEVIKGWEDGVATMKRGERAIFKIPPSLAYGNVGYSSSPLIPPNSTLIFEIEMLSWCTIKDLTGDGGIMKKIIKEGEGWATPKQNDEVLVKYEARLEDGMVASKSEEGVEFNIDDGYLCPAMSIAAKTMRKGEIVELAVKFHYGSGQLNDRTAEFEGSRIPSSNLTIKLELVSWKSVIDITGDKKVLKKIQKAGEGFDRPNEGSLVKVIYTSKLEDGTVIEKKGSEDEPFMLIIQEEQLHEGLERAIMTMKKGEKALVTLSGNSLSHEDNLGTFSANETLHCEVVLIDFIKEKPFWKMDTEEKLEACERKKQDGNVLYRAEKFWRASKKYEKAVGYIEFDHTFSQEEKCEANALRVTCILNNAACKLKMGEYVEASKLCTKVLECDPVNVKALYRRSQAYIKTSELEKAEFDIKKALAIDPNNRDMKLEYKELKSKQKEHSRYAAEIFGTMFPKMCN